MCREKDQSPLTVAAEQCRFEEVRSRVKKAVLNASQSQKAVAAEKNRQLQEQEWKQSHSDFLANMSHDLRSPLNSVIGFSEVLLDQLYGSINEKQQEYLKSILASGLHLRSLIDNIIDLATMETGELTLELSRFSLREALEAALQNHRETALRSGVKIHLEFAPQADVRILADQSKFKRILFTLLGNALKYTTTGGTVNVSVVCNGENIEMTVADTGLGIKVEEIPKLFRATPQHLETAGSGKDPDLGMSLVLVRKMVELHGGRIWVKSYFGMGSRFTFTLPYSPEIVGATTLSTEPRRGDGKTILLIEDEQLTLAATGHALHDQGYRVIRAKDGEDGIEMARCAPPDLIVLDLMLPGINGFDVVERLYNEKMTENIPILVLTSMKIRAVDRERLSGKIWKIAGKGSLSTHEFINLVEIAVAAQ